MQGEFDRCVSAIKRFEGLHKQVRPDIIVPYLCPAGVLTIGYGSTGEWVTKDLVMTERQCSQALIKYIDNSLLDIYRSSPKLFTDRNFSRLEAIISFVHNLGISNYNGSTLKRMVDKENWSAASQEIKKWNKSGGKVLPGLIKRRAWEASLILENL